MDRYRVVLQSVAAYTKGTEAYLVFANNKDHAIQIVIDRYNLFHEDIYVCYISN